MAQRGEGVNRTMGAEKTASTTVMASTPSSATVSTHDADPSGAQGPRAPANEESDNNVAGEDSRNEVAATARADFRKDYRFWVIMLTLCLAVTLSSLETTIVITSLPTIVEKVDLGENYIWVANAYFLAK